MVVHVTRVHIVLGILAGNGKCRRNSNHVARLLPVVVERQGESILEKKCIKAEVRLCGRLPFEVLVTHTLDGHAADDILAGTVEVVASITEVIGIGSIVSVRGIDGRVAVLPPSDAHLQVTQDIVFVEELLFRHTPGSREGREDTGVVVLEET